MIRKYAPMILIVMMSLFVVALAIAEYTDSRRIAEDLKIETCVELETEDYEWDEFDDDSGICNIAISQYAPIHRPLCTISNPLPSPRISDKQRLGLVRRYAPRKALTGNNYVLT